MSSSIARITFEPHREVPCSHDWHKVGHDLAWVYYFCPLCGGRGCTTRYASAIPPAQIDWVLGKSDALNLSKREDDPEGLSPMPLARRNENA